MRKQTICIDFDGVLHAYTSGWKGASVIPDGPVTGAIAWLCDLVDPLKADDAVTVVVQSSRARRPWGWFAIRNWLRRYIFEHMGSDMVRADDIYSAISVTSRKPAASAHRPWNARGKQPRP